MPITKGFMHVLKENGGKLMEKKPKKRFALWANEETLDLVKKSYEDDDCRSQSEFIEKAIIFYSGYLSHDRNQNYFSNVVISTLKAIVDESTTKTQRIIFKQAVELATVENILAVREKIDKITLERLRGKCVEEVKRLNGQFDFTDAMLWQHGDF
jgi:hypothetical protein